MKKNYILIDYENVQPAALQALTPEHFNVMVFVGSSQAKVSCEIVFALQSMGNRASYVKIQGQGRNALDFHIAFYIGQLASREPEALFHVISKDTGFDPLIAHLKDLGIRVRRSNCVSDLQPAKAAKPAKPAKPIASVAPVAPAPAGKAATPAKLALCTSVQDRTAAVLANLNQRGNGKPGTLKTLSGTIQNLFGKALSELEVKEIVDRLVRLGFLTVKAEKVSYGNPPAVNPAQAEPPTGS